MGVFDDIIERESIAGSLFVSGVTTGTVKENWNQDFPGKVRVELLLGEDGKNLTGWIPVSMPYGGDEYGMYTLPEVGAEVVIAFNMGDRNCPIVIGSLWNNKNKLPPETAVDKNTVKRFKTKGGCEVVFTDEENKAMIDIHTPGKLQIEINDEKKTITIQDDGAKNSIKIDAENGVLELVADKKISLSAGGKAELVLDGQSGEAKLSADNVKLDAKQGLNLKGQQTALEGGTIEIKAQSTMKQQAGAMLEIKGAMVKIN